MATAYTRLQSISPPAANLPVRPFSEFDAGLNASSAWTEHLEMSDGSERGSHTSEHDQPDRSARALYDFEGKVEFGELTVQAGDDLLILDEYFSEGWSLAKFEEETGLIPHTYYTVSS